MALRFSDTEKWKDDWYLSIDNDTRIIYQWLIDNCNHAGIIKKEFQMLNLCCHVKVDSEKLKTMFGDRLLDCGDFFFITKFLKTQYPGGLDSSKPSVKSVRSLLARACANSVTIKQWLDNNYKTVNKPLSNDSPIIKDKDKDISSSSSLKKRESEEREEKPSPTPEKLATLWNRLAHMNLPKVDLRIRFSAKRMAHAKARLEEHPTVEFWESVIGKINASSFLTGKSSDFKCSFDWMINPSNLPKIMEGNYDDKHGSSNQSRGDRKFQGEDGDAAMGSVSVLLGGMD